MLQQTIRSLIAHKRRFFATALAVVLGVAFMSGTMVLTSTMTATFDGLFADINRGTDAYVRSSGEVAGTRDRIDRIITDAIAGVDGVAAVAPVVEGYAQLVGADGKAVDPAQGAPALGTSWIADDELNPYRVIEGRAPSADGEIAIDGRTADLSGYRPGDPVRVLTQRGVTTFTISAVTAFGDADTPAGATVVAFTPADAEQHLSQPGRIDAVAVAATDGVSQPELQERLASELPGFEVLTGAELTEERQDDVGKGIGMITTFLLAFAVIALFVGAFIIHNTFSIVIAQRTKELAMLRALGAGRGQIMATITGEAIGVGAIASAAGLAVGLGVAEGLRALLAAIGLELTGDTVISTSALVTPFVVGVLVCLASAVMPARKATSIPPVAAMREVAVESPKTSRRRVVIGAVLVATAAAAILGSGTGGPSSLVAVGALLALVGVKVLAPAMAVPIAELLGAPLAALRGVSGRLARDNAARNPKRTAATASALMIGVALVGGASIIAASTKGAVSTAVDEAMTADLVLDAGRFSPGMSPTVAERVRRLPGVAAVSPLRYVQTTVEGGSQLVLGYDPATVERMMDLQVTAGSLAGLGTDGLAVQADVAADRGWTLGSTVSLRFPAGAVDLTVEALYGERFASGSYIVGIERLASGFPTDLDQNVLVAYAEGVDETATRAAIEAEVAEFPTVTVLDRQEYADQQAGNIDQFLTLIYALLGLAIVIALIGIVNTLGLSIHERTRELGLLRAVGMSRRQLRAVVRWEAVIIATFGTLLGLGLGVAVGWAAVSALDSSGIEHVVVPGGQLGMVAVLGAVAGVGAAVLPGRRAARLDVLQAISAD